MDRLTSALSKFPRFYNREVQDAGIRAFVKAFTDELGMSDDQIARLGALNSVDTTYDEDLEPRWGKLLNIPRKSGEDGAIYRNRLKTSVTDLAGGTYDAIKYAIAVSIGINGDPVATDNCIKIIDAWLYTGTEPIDKSNGCFVVTVDLNNILFEYRQSISDVVTQAVKNTKASGTKGQLLFYNYRIMTYGELDTITYLDLSALRYDQIGG